jgi:hypothetical protein
MKNLRDCIAVLLSASAFVAMSARAHAIAPASFSDHEGAILSLLTEKFIGKVGHGSLYENGQLLMPTEHSCTLIRDTKEGYALKEEQYILRDGRNEVQWAKDFAEFQLGHLTKIDMGHGKLKRYGLNIGYVGVHGENGLSDSGQIRLSVEPDHPIRFGNKFLSSSLTYEAAYKETPVAEGRMQGWQICYADNAPKETGPWNYIEAGHDPSKTCDSGDGMIIDIGGTKHCCNDNYWINKRIRNTKWHKGIENDLDSKWTSGAAGYCYRILFSHNEVQLSSIDIDGAGTKIKETKRATCQY